MDKQKLPVVYGGWLLFLFLAWMVVFPVKTQAAVVEPSFETLPVDSSMITTAGKAGAPSGSANHRYVQINDNTTNSSGAVWFNNPVSFTSDFKIEMAFFIENAANDSDGLAFVMQSNGPNSLASEAASTIGVWANMGSSNPVSQGAIPNSIAIEFDTFYNNLSNIIARDGMMDRDVSSKGHHIAWAYPGVDSSYTTDGIIIIDKVLHHNNVVGVQDLSDGQWHDFTVEFKKSDNTFTYKVPDYNVNVTIPVDDTFKKNLGLNAGKSVYFGFTGANGGYAQAKAVSFVDVQGLVDLELRTGIFTPDNMQLILDTSETNPTINTLDKDQELTYLTALNYLSTSDMLSLKEGTVIRLLVPSTLDLVGNTVKFFKVDDTSSVGLPTEGESIPFTRTGDTLSVTLPDLERGNMYGIFFSVKNNYIEIDKNLDLKVPATTTFSGNAFASPILLGSPDTHYYKFTGSWNPSTADSYNTTSEAKANAQIVRQNRKAYFPIEIDDENSTSVTLFMTPLVTEDELPTAEFSEKTVLSREQLTDPLNATIEYETADLQPGNIYYVGIYAVDKEGNQSPTVYKAVDFRGIIQLNTVPGDFNGQPVTINELVNSKQADGFYYIKVNDLVNANLALTNTSENLWALDGQLNGIAEQLTPWGEDLSLSFFEKGTKNLVFQLTNEKQSILTQETAGAADLIQNFNEYDIYFKFKATPLSIIPGTYSGTVNWSLSSAGS